MARTLLTIGDLTSGTPLSRQAQRRSRAVGRSPVDASRYSERFAIGSADSNTAGGALQDAAMALLNHFDTSGATPESVADPVVGAFQRAWNADPANGGDQLVVDSKYGPLTYGAQRAMVGDVAQPVNGGASPAVVPPPGVVTPGSGDSQTGPLLVIVGVLGVAAYFLFFRKKKRGAVHHHGSVVEIKSNPRRRARRLNSLIV